MKKLFCLCIVIIGLLSSCSESIHEAADSNLPVFQNSQAHQHWVESLKTWQAKGSFSFIKGKESLTGSFDWKKLGENKYQLHFYGPLGSHPMQLKVTPKEAIWIEGENTIHAHSAEQLIFEQTGYDVPVSSVVYWILGWTSPNPFDFRVFDLDERITSFEQSGWNVEYLSYQRVANGELPKMLVLSVPHEKMRIKLFVREWRV